MAKKSSLKHKRNLKQNYKFKPGLLIVIIIVILGMLMLALPSNVFLSSKSTKQKQSTRPEPKFKKEGELTFLSQIDKSPIRTIEIEIADNDFERALGLMYRKHMDYNKGMLFIQEYEEEQSFWMKNTYISLDIIYIDSDFKIVSIAKNTEPFSFESIPSGEDAKYVVEVINGFCNKFNVKTGDSIIYSQI